MPDSSKLVFKRRASLLVFPRALRDVGAPKVDESSVNDCSTTFDGSALAILAMTLE